MTLNDANLSDSTTYHYNTLQNLWTLSSENVKQSMPNSNRKNQLDPKMAIVYRYDAIKEKELGKVYTLFEA
jgi:hypothetical protein